MAKRKKANELTDKELIRRLFPPDVRKALKKAVLELNREPQKTKKR